MRVVAILLVALCGYYLFLFLIQRFLLYPAPRGPFAAAIPPDVQRVGLADPHGVVDAWYLPPVPGTPARHAAVIFMHGNAERAEDWTGHVQALQRAGIAILIPEYPGYGESPGSPTETSLTDAALAAYDWLRLRPDVDPARIVSYGRSLGGGVAARLATRRQVAALVLESSFTSLRSFARGFFAPGFLVRDPFDNLTELSRYRGPLLVLHGERDEVAPFAHGRALAAAVPGAVFVPMRCGHNDCERPWPDVLRFLARHEIVNGMPP